MEIRAANFEDGKSVLGLIEELENQKFEQNKFFSIFQKNLQNPSIFYFVAEAEGTTIGFLSLYINELLHHCNKVAEIQELIVNEHFRSKKIGSKLIDFAETFIKSKDVDQLELCTNQKRLKAHSFYLRKQFKRTHFKFVKILNS